MEITEENYLDAYEAIRDILFMYVDMVKSYRGFGHNINTGTFKALNFIDVNLNEPDGYSFCIDINLLQIGAAIALICEISDQMDECPDWNKPYSQSTKLIKHAFQNNAFAHMHEINEAMGYAFNGDEENFRLKLSTIYQNHVRKYIQDLSNEA